eukprot:2063797-Pyramimonas_sp.AAC.2
MKNKEHIVAHISLQHDVAYSDDLYKQVCKRAEPTNMNTSKSTSFYGSSCANNGKGALTTPEPSEQMKQHNK